MFYVFKKVKYIVYTFNKRDTIIRKIYIFCQKIK